MRGLRKYWRKLAAVVAGFILLAGGGLGLSGLLLDDASAASLPTGWSGLGYVLPEGAEDLALSGASTNGHTTLEKVYHKENSDGSHSFVLLVSSNNKKLNGAALSGQSCAVRYLSANGLRAIYECIAQQPKSSDCLTVNAENNPAHSLECTSTTFGTLFTGSVEYKYSNNIVGAPDLSGYYGLYSEGSLVDVAGVPALAGYRFVGWTTSDASVVDGKFTMPNHSVVFMGAWVAAADLSYTVEYYYDGVIDDSKTVTVDDVTFGTVINTYTDKVIDGYVLEGVDTIPMTVGTDSNVIKVSYVKRADLSYTVEYYYDGVIDDELTYSIGGRTFRMPINCWSIPFEPKEGYRFDRYSCETLIISAVDAENVIEVHYITVARPRETPFTTEIRRFLDGTYVSYDPSGTFVTLTDTVYERAGRNGYCDWNPVTSKWDICHAPVNAITSYYYVSNYPAPFIPFVYNPVDDEPEVLAEETPVPVRQNRVATVVDEPEVLGESGNAWSLVNLLLAILTGLISIVLLICFFGKKEEETKSEKVQTEIKKKGALRLSSIIPFAAALIIFIIVEDMTQPMGWVNKWTIVMLLIAVVQIAIAFFSRKTKKSKTVRRPA